MNADCLIETLKDPTKAMLHSSIANPVVPVSTWY